MRKTTIAWKHARLLLPTVWLLLMACEKKDPLPKPTQEGKNTFGCKINGKSWVPDGGKGFQATKPVMGGFFGIVMGTFYRRGIYINAVSRDDQEVVIYLDGYQKANIF